MTYSLFQNFFFFACICIDHVFSLPSSSAISYTKHCSFIVPECNITTLTKPKSVPTLSTSYFTGGNTFLHKQPSQPYFGEKSLSLQIRPDSFYQTTAAGVYKVEGSLSFSIPFVSYPDQPRYISDRDGRFGNQGPGSIEFPLKGFWSEKSRKLCMLGSTLWKGSDRHAVLKLKLADEIPTIYTSVASGSFESTAASANDRSYFDPITIFSFSTVPDYSYSLVSKEAFSSDADAFSSLPAHEFCSAIEWGLTNLELQYATEGGSPVGISLPFFSLSSIHCQERGNNARFMAVFHNYTSYRYDDFDAGSTLIGEVSWDGENKRMIGVACGISNPPLELGNVVETCTVMFSLRFPSILKVSNDATVVGQIWSSKSVDDSGYFDKIIFEGNDKYGPLELPGLKYEYTEMDRVRKLCPVKKTTKKGNVYPDEHSYNMRFDINVNDDQGLHLSWATARPSWVGNDTYKDGAMPPVGAESYSESAAKMSYKIIIGPYYAGHSSKLSSLIWGMNPTRDVEITAEGLYDSKNGFLCMVGCRKVNSTFKDCDVVVELEFPPLNGKKGDPILIKGVIRSTRSNDDLYFDNLLIASAAPYPEEALRWIWRMDFEITMVLISNMLVCIFVALQIFHVKRNHEVPSFISVVMLVILCIGHMIPLVLNFDAVYLGNHGKQTLALGSGGRLEANEVAVRVITMVTFLLQLRLLHLVWTAKQNINNGKSSWIGEIKASFVCLSLYILGWLVTLLINWVRNTHVRPHTITFPVWDDLRSYVGLILDGFLVPQIILNIFLRSAEKALSHPFYLGMSAVRLMPHVYNQYRTQNYSNYDLTETYYYANPIADFYSTAWDIMIPKFPSYYYSLVWKEAFSSDAGARKDESLSLRAHEFCSAIEWGLTNLEVQYAEECTSCSPVGISLPFLSVTSIHCQERERKARFMAVFRNYTSYRYDDEFDAGSTLIGEVSWDGESKRMIGVACGISNPPLELGNVVENCTVRLSLRFPSILKVSNDAKVVGEIWSSKSVGDSGYFDKIIFDSNDIFGEMGLPEINYEYTELERVKKLCPLKKTVKKGNVYPNEHSYNMRFDMNIMDGQGLHLSWANARPSWVGNETYKDGVMPPVGAESGTIRTSPAKMSYKIGINPYYDVYTFNFSRPIWGMNQNHEEKFTDEGLYDTKNGFLCMVGCRRVNSTFKDCDMVVEFEFPPLNGNKDALIKGMIRSTRATNDALYFDNLIIESATPYDEDGVRSIWRMDFEITVVLITNMLVCIFVALQIFHVKRNHEVPSLISLVMLVVLCVGHMIPLVLNSDAVYLGNRDKQTLALGSGGRLEANEVAVRVITMVTFLLQLRLLHLVWIAKQNNKDSWAGEIKASFVCLSLYILGWLFTLLINWMWREYVTPFIIFFHNYSAWDDLRSYAGLILDGFLVPQIILNIFKGSRKKALSHPFYVGTSVVRIVPHVYNQYRKHNYPMNHLKGAYYYANPTADFYSTAWDIMIPFGIVVLVVIVFLQQHLGGRCILPKRFRASGMFEKLSRPLTTSEEENAD